ncbi:unnamed protein product [Cylicocyclus nassatus]|uniref:Uncharacterized protein n=1 Tax=Cylicocyclus nassatus TaxID=53992 RepID=A0AA36MEG8_CYLNA|nr:unnamed protein product [Cylicocyclus nassatus]
MAYAALAAYTTMYDDHKTPRVTATVPSLASYPLRLKITLADMPSGKGWTKHRPVSVWIRDAGRYTRVEVEEATFLSESRQAVARRKIHEDLREAGGDTTFIELAYGAVTLGCMTDEEAEQV